VVVEAGTPSDAFYVILAGAARVLVGNGNEQVEVAQLKSPDAIGEMGLLLGEPRTATVVVTDRSMLLKFEAEAFRIMYDRVPGFGITISQALANRLKLSSHKIPLPSHSEGGGAGTDLPDAETLAMLPMALIQRHRVIPLAAEGNQVTLGLVDDPNPVAMNQIRELLPGMVLAPVRINASLYEQALQSVAGVEGWSKPGAAAAAAAAPPTPAGPSKTPRLDALLRRMIAEGASDVHLTAGEQPRWRIDGEMALISDAPVLGAEEVYEELLKPVMAERNIDEYEQTNDTDFAYAIEGLARFRVNLFRDRTGSGAVFRQIPAKILTLEQLNLPPVVRSLCDHPKGLVLVTGPTGSGKSTTLAAMIDYINKTRKQHIITLEDPIEFVHKSQAALVNQREVGPHTQSFSRALRAALREDPDIVLVGELRDLETVSLALETANTGHLVFGTLHTATAISTVDRIIDLFPSEQQNQVRTVLSETLKGVVAQTLLKRNGGGRVAALEILVGNHAVSNLVREGKTFQIFSIMSTQKRLGNQLLNEELHRLVQEGTVSYEEAALKALDKADLAKRCGKPPPAA
jgi:twitching motility protein PilT